ncbi:MAG TPA: succinate dehydrogenase, partial [Armatimonadota bacterium]|nr:succinate dehydrogenase [Armatimonadota bacterium]
SKPRDNFELRSWYFMRVSGALIVVLAIIHLIYVHYVHGVDEISAGFIAERWLNPTWRIFDFVLLTLALLHGGNGMRILVDDYIRPKGWRTFALTSLYIVVFLLFAVGGLVMLTYQG